MAHRIWLPVALVVIVFASTVYLCGGSVWIYFDLPSLILVPIAPFLFVTLSFGWKSVGAAFRAPLRAGADKRELAASASFFKSLGAAIWAFGALGSTIGVIAILANLTDKSKVGPNAAVALITMLYSGIFNVVLVLPFLSATRRRVAGMDC
jgi:flagellar motor component MotA